MSRVLRTICARKRRRIWRLRHSRKLAGRGVAEAGVCAVNVARVAG